MESQLNNEQTNLDTYEPFEQIKIFSKVQAFDFSDVHRVEGVVEGRQGRWAFRVFVQIGISNRIFKVGLGQGDQIVFC
jgi:hypothetical protein